MRKNKNSPNFRKGYNQNPISGCNARHLYSHSKKSISSQDLSKIRLNKNTMDIISSYQQRSKISCVSKDELSIQRTQIIVEYSEGIKEIEKVDPELVELWNMFEFEKNILRIDISTFLKHNKEKLINLHIGMLLEGLEYFFDDIRNLIDLLEVPIIGMVTEILKCETVNICINSQEDMSLTEVDVDNCKQKNLLSKCIRLLLKASEIKEKLNEKLMIEKICENKKLHIKNLEEQIINQSILKKTKKQSNRLNEMEKIIETKDKQIEYFRNMINNLIEKNGLVASGVNTLFKMFQSTNDLQRTLQIMSNNGSPLRFHTKDPLYTINEQSKKLDQGNIKENDIWTEDKQLDNSKMNFIGTLGMPQASEVYTGRMKEDIELMKPTDLFSPMKRTANSKDTSTPKTPTFVKISNF